MSRCLVSDVLLLVAQPVCICRGPHITSTLPASQHAAACDGAEEAATLVFYVPPHSLAAVLADAAEVLGSDRSCVVARELTKVDTVCNSHGGASLPCG